MTPEGIKELASEATGAFTNRMSEGGGSAAPQPTGAGENGRNPLS
jgi:hypothetical protein